MQFNLIVLAAGKGSRFQNHKPNFSKMLIPILDKPIINYVLDNCHDCGYSFSKKIIVVGHQRQIIIDHLGTDYIYATQPIQNGTGGAVMVTTNYLDISDSSLIICGDTPLISSATINKFIKHFLNTNSVCSFITAHLDNPTGYGRVIEDHNIAIIEEKDASDEVKQIKEVNGGIYLFKNEVLLRYISLLNSNNAQKEFYLTDLIKLISNENKVTTFPIENSDEILGVNNYLDLVNVSDKINYQHNYSLASSGVNLESFYSIFISQYAKISVGATICASSKIIGESVIEEDVVIGPNCQINCSIIKKGSHVNHSIISDSVIGENNIIGPFAHIRNNAQLDSNCQIGNFVEIKKSILGKESKAKHLSYLGDAIIANHVNIGCGVITANYDGKKKHPTIIKDNAFIGSNVNLIAPITIGENALIAAGSTITEDVGPNDLAIARARQTNKKNYRKKET